MGRAARGFRYAKVTVTAEFAPATTTVVVAAEAFHWLRAAHGPDAWIDGPGIETFREETRAGAALALRHVKARVVIDRIEFTNVDTSPGDVEQATCRAVWQALGVNDQ